MTTIIHIVGNRPQFIKLAILHKEFAASESVVQKIVHTGQHSSQQMSGIFFSELEIPVPDRSIEISAGTTNEVFIANTTHHLLEYFLNFPGAIIFAYGDTNTTLAAAMAARRSGNPFYHFEAGIRTGDNRMPEEVNRIIADRFADVNYCCTQLNYDKMIAEGYGSAIPGRVVLTGDLMYDAFLHIKAAEENIIEATNYVACTIHRAGNILSREHLAGIIDGLNDIHEKIPVFMPVHPHTQKRIEEYGLQPHFLTLPPIGYPEMKTFLQRATFVITDSGGTAREAFFCQKRSVVVMEKPFWPEIIYENCSIQSSPSRSALTEAFSQLPSLDPNFHAPIFGMGDAARLIKEDILHHLT